MGSARSAHGIAYADSRCIGKPDRLGYRRLRTLLLRKGWSASKKLVYRLYRVELDRNTGAHHSLSCPEIGNRLGKATHFAT